MTHQSDATIVDGRAPKWPVVFAHEALTTTECWPCRYVKTTSPLHALWRSAKKRKCMSVTYTQKSGMPPLSQRHEKTSAAHALSQV